MINAYEDDGDGRWIPPRTTRSRRLRRRGSTASYKLTLAGGDYVICEQLPADWVQSFPNPGDGDARTSPITPTRATP